MDNAPARLLRMQTFDCGLRFASQRNFRIAPASVLRNQTADCNKTGGMGAACTSNYILLNRFNQYDLKLIFGLFKRF